MKLTGQAEWIMWVRLVVREAGRGRVGEVTGSKGRAWSLLAAEEEEEGRGSRRERSEAWSRESGSLPLLRTGQ